MSRVWYAQDAGFMSDPRIQQLGAKFGPGGPLAITHMLGVAKLQSLTGEHPEGHLRLGYAALSHAVFLDGWETASRIVAEAVRVQIFELIEDSPDDFEVRFLRWSEYQRDHTATERKRRQRAREKLQTPAESPVGHGDVTPMSRDGHALVTPYIDKDNDKGQNLGTSPRSSAGDSVRVVRKNEQPELVDAAAGRAEELCVTLADLIEENGSKRPTITNTWRLECRRMLTRDNRDPVEVEQLLRWCQADTFWKSNILSMPKFRQQYDRLRLRMLNESPGRPKGAVDEHVNDLIARAEELRRRGR